MEVKLIDSTVDPLYIISYAARTCYNSNDKDELNKRADFVKGLIKSGHETPLEFASATFEVSGISRVCYDKNTEILTESGWKFFSEIDKRDKIATRNEKGEVEFNFPSEIIKYKYNGLMHKYNNQSIDLCVTPNHNLFIKKYDVRNKTNYFLFPSNQIDFNRFYFTREFDYKKKSLEDIIVKGFEYERKNRNGEKYIKYTGDLTFNKKTFIKFLAWFLSDGSVYYDKNENKYVISISQSDTKINLERKTKERIKDLIVELGFNPSICKNKISFCSMSLGSFLKDLGVSYEKYIPYNLFCIFDKELAKSFIDEYLYGDGNIDKNGSAKLYTTSKNLSDQLQILCYIAGYTSTIHTREYKKEDTVIIKGRTYNHKAKAYYTIYVTTSNKKYARNRNVVIKKNKHFSTELYNDMVYCVNVPNHIIFVRRNGKPVWCGNCQNQMVRHRHASFCVMSERYVDVSKMDCVLPASLLSEYEGAYDYAQEAKKIYKFLVSSGIKREDARLLLPQGMETRLCVNFNFRALRHFLKLRLDKHAQAEIRSVAREIYFICDERLPWLVEDIKKEFDL